MTIPSLNEVAKLNAEIARLRALVAVKNEALRVLADQNNWDAEEWTAYPDPIGEMMPYEFAQAALEKE